MDHNMPFEQFNYNLSFEDFTEWVRSVPMTGIYTRERFDEFNRGGLRIEHENVTIIAGINYRCLDPYSPTQRCLLSGVHLSVYTGQHQVKSGVVTNPDKLLDAVNELAEQARTLCEHEYGRELSTEECRQRGIGHYGSCWHVYECPKCKETFSVDSSG